MRIFSFLKNFVNLIVSEHDEVMALTVETDRNFSRSKTSIFFVFLHKESLNMYVHGPKAAISLLA